MSGSANRGAGRFVRTMFTVLAAIALTALVGNAAHARAHHHAPAAGNTSGKTSVAKPFSIGTSPTGGDVDHPLDLDAGATGQTGRPRERAGERDRALRHGPADLVAPTDADRIDDAMFGNRTRSFKQRAGIVWPTNGPIKAAVAGGPIAGGAAAADHGLHRHFVVGSAMPPGRGRDAIGMLRVSPADERARDRDGVDRRVGPAAGLGTPSTTVEPPKFEGLHPMIHPPTKVDAVINGTGAGVIGAGAGHAVRAPAALGGPAPNVATIGGNAFARPRR
jgi:hypothetical protein